MLIKIPPEFELTAFILLSMVASVGWIKLGIGGMVAWLILVLLGVFVIGC
jgi:hypothetical protein